MPAIAPQTDVIYVLEMPFATDPARYHYPDPLQYYSRATRMTATEAAQALRRFLDRLFINAPIAGMLDPLTAQGDLKSFAESKGIDFNKLVSGAARHFTSASIARRTSPLSSKELERLFEDDQQSFGNNIL